MTYFDQFREALESENPTLALRQVVIGFRNQGIDEDTLVQALQDFRQDLNEPDEDVVLEVLDFLTGFCSSFMRID